ncbi:hypothetical protein ESY86_08775 [Subsaximicrobium wynnwilliamsii]|uniref:DUF4252 domain-containing protein n=1 Tax=Subsaximicrobium wynnwilliamsii TaxID=291179 RepID=A0A5C6ZJH5_9FLAO|nr:hypothetical protein [Subsaximicrobium wynnwilliamsii]TXD83651.1 hypothetical protein ESY87_08430 [Subsaximicrobium wynnwilliamsii]TXD89464.1 hypothetical protein ESY86_08775 [Subsaximicrobium wynnwilliamsii]TXE03488.1 hypothetical protein ESY88_07455 [Subsaximicrobium wynnwilliamsii]
MKNMLRLTLVAMLLIACKDANQAKTMEGAVNEAIGNNEDVNQKYDHLLKELNKITPLTNAQLLKAFPEKLGNLSLDASGKGSNETRITSSETVVGSFGDNKVRMEILDAAGKNAYGAIIPLKMLQLNKVTSESNNTIRYSKKERNALLIFGTDRDEDTKADYQSELRLLYDNRFYITLEGKQMQVDELWGAINMDDLTRFKDYNQ